MPPDLFASPRALINEARADISALDQLVQAFIGAKNWAIVIERDQQSGDNLLKAQFDNDIPARAVVLVRRIANDLRAALDHAVYASAVAWSGGEPEGTSFPFGRFRDDVEKRLRDRGNRALHQDVVALLLATEPYEGGNVTLRSLNRLRNTNDHRVLTPMHLQTTKFGYRPRGAMWVDRLDAVSRWIGTRRQLVFAAASPQTQLNAEFDVSFDVALNPRFGTAEVAAVEWLTTAADEVDRIVMAVEAETARVVEARG